MKTFPILFLASMASYLPVLSQDAKYSSPENQAASPTAARILGNIPDGTPPPPEPPRPKFVVPAKDVLASKTVEQGGRKITVQKINPISLPPPPPPPGPPSAEAVAAFRVKAAEYRKKNPRARMMFLSATVFRSKDSPPRSLVRCWPEGKGETITFWSSADFGLISGIHSFADSTGNIHSLMMSWGYMDGDRKTKLQGGRSIAADAPALPVFPLGRAAFEVTGKLPEAEDLAPIQALHDLYNNDSVRLKTAFDGREQARIEREAYLKAHPPQPKDITLRYWRTQRPATAEGGAR